MTVGAPSSASDTRGGRSGRPPVESAWANSSFWLLQVVVLALTLIRIVLTVTLPLDTTSPTLELSTVAIFLIPVVYAALVYGFAGALFTAAWVTLLAIPRLVMYAHNRDAVGMWAELMQVLVLDVIAILVGHRVSAERTARQVAEAAEQAHTRAEALYRNLFDSNQAPILITDSEGRLVEANASAHRVFPRSSFSALDPGTPEERRPRLLDVIGADAAGQVLTRLVAVRTSDEVATASVRVKPVAIDVDGERSLFRPTATVLEDAGGINGMQVVFEDVTAETKRHDRMEAYATQVVIAQEEERRHLAQELHDGPVQTLIHLCRQIDTVGAPFTGIRESAPALSDLRLTVEGTVAELRGIAKGLRPSILDDLGLVASVSQLLADAERRSLIDTSIEVVGSDRRLPVAVELALFRVAQEAISNVERHAQAAQVEVRLEFGSDDLRLRIRDDGIGPPAAANAEGFTGDSLGLPGMAERARLLGGTFAILSDPRGGTAVDIRVPNPPAGEP